MKKEHMLGIALFALVLLFTGVFTVHGNFLGMSLSGATSPVDEPKAPRGAPDVEDEAASKTSGLPSAAQLMERIHENPRRLPVLPPEAIDSETLWLARCIYSETKRPEEMELVAWVIRNRVETQYRGKQTYRGVVLDPYQFSAFNPGNRKRQYYMGLSPRSAAKNWQRALTIAYGVRKAPPDKRPFPPRTRHFYSERSMVGRIHPDWASGLQPVEPERSFALDDRRFRFFEGVY